MRELLVCPRDRSDLIEKDGQLVCEHQHAYPVVDGIPVLLLDEDLGEHHAIAQSLAEARSGTVEEPAVGPGEIDPVVQHVIGATSGHLYSALVGKLTAYPIPELRLPDGDGRLLLDLGCNWGRWSIAAARKGYRVVGLDPDLGCLLAARRVAKQLGLSLELVCADARHLPFRDQGFDVVFSYSVIQHLPKEDARRVFAGVRRVTRAEGEMLIQMPNAFGVRCLYHQLRRGLRSAERFEVRYWTPRELLEASERMLGPTELSVDGYFGLGIQASDAHLLPVKHRLVVQSSEWLRRLSHSVPALIWCADSLYLRSRRTP